MPRLFWETSIILEEQICRGNGTTGSRAPIQAARSDLIRTNPGTFRVYPAPLDASNKH